MKVTVTVRESEFLSRVYQVGCGKGNQYVNWVAQAACLQFGQEHYPAGIYVPTLLRLSDGTIPHPRKRANSCIKDGEHLYVTLKNRARKTSSEEDEWYQQAYGKLKNIMNVRVLYKPQNPEGKKGKFRYFLLKKYMMYPEMQDEFDPEEYPQEEEIEMEEFEDENDNFEYEKEISLPYGQVDFTLRWSKKEHGEDEEDITQDITNKKELDCVFTYFTPKPVSKEEQFQLDQEEEEDNKRKEHDARMAQKKREEDKAKQKYEQQKLIAKQEANTALLEVYFKQMNLHIHRSDKDFNSSLSYLSIYHLDLAEHFAFYSGLQPPVFRKTENQLVTLQAVLHFMKVINLASSRHQVSKQLEALGDLINLPLTDTLNIKNGLNYAQFLESLLRIAYFKLDESEMSQSDSGYSNMLEDMFLSPNVDIKKYLKKDKALEYMYSQPCQQVFYENYSLLGAIFTQKGMLHMETFLEMSKHEFINILRESGIIDDKKGDDLPGWGPEAIMAQIRDTSSFDQQALGYIDFLECLVRIADIYPFPHEEKANNQHIDQKLTSIVKMLEEKYEDLVEGFADQMNKKQKEMSYQPKMVIDDEGDDDDY